MNDSISKGKKKRKQKDDDRTPLHHAAEAALEQAQADAVKREYSQAQRRQLAREGNALVGADGHVSYPIADEEDLHNAAILARTGHGDVEGARRLIARRARELGVSNPLAKSHSEGQLFAGNGNPAGNPYAAMRDCDNPHVAYAHPDLRQSSTDTSPFARLEQRAGGFVGQAAFGGLSADSDNVIARVNVSSFDAAGQAGTYQGMNDFSDNPNRPGWHQHRDSATPDNGSHNSDSQYGACTTPRQSMKSSDALEIMKRALRGEI